MDISTLNNYVSLTTPVILLAWFYYSQRRELARKYYEELEGIYAGYVDPLHKDSEQESHEAGIIMRIRAAHDKGFVRGEFDHGEVVRGGMPNSFFQKLVRNGLHMFLGKFDFELFFDRTRHPFVKSQNRVYGGKMYIMDRLDLDIHSQDFKNFLVAEYQISHYREMQAIEFTLLKKHREEHANLPDKFMLYKTLGMSFEPYRNVKETVFGNRTFSDQ